MVRIFDVGIVGGGPGGLMTAYALQRLADHPIRVTLFEASSRVGGKILTPAFRTAPIRYEAGAAEFYDYAATGHDPLKDLIAELGLPIRRMGGPAVVMDQRILANLDDIRDRLGPDVHRAIVEFDRLAKDRITSAEFYVGDGGEGSTAPPERLRFDSVLESIRDPEARRYIETLIHSDLATEPGSTSPTYGLQNYVMNDARYMELYGIEGGNERLPQELANRLDATMRMEQPVRAIERRPDGKLGVHSVADGEVHIDEFDFVVIALPHNHLRSVAYPGARLATAMVQHIEHYNFPAHYLRISALFDKPFWKNAFTDSYWMLDQLGGCCLYDESSRTPGCKHGVLGWLLGGDAAHTWTDKSDDELIEAALDSLPDFLAHGREHFLEGVVHRWIDSVNAMPGGLQSHNLDVRHRPEPVEHPHLFAVGDYLFDTTLNGVLDSAEYVAAWIAALLIENHACPPKTTPKRTRSRAPAASPPDP